MSAESDLIASRYGKTATATKRTRNLIILAAAIVLAGFLSWAAWVSLSGAAEVKSKDLSYEILNQNQATVKFSVELPPNASQGAICAVQVLNQGFAVVGYRELEIAPGASGTYQTLVNTTELGVSGHLDKCWLK